MNSRGASNSRRAAVIDINEFWIFFEQFKDARVLPCAHKLCLRCIKKLGETKRPEDKLPCPLCRQEFTIPEGGFRMLPQSRDDIDAALSKYQRETKQLEDELLQATVRIDRLNADNNGLMFENSVSALCFLVLIRLFSYLQNVFLGFLVPSSIIIIIIMLQYVCGLFI